MVQRVLHVSDFGKDMVEGKQLQAKVFKGEMSSHVWANVAALALLLAVASCLRITIIQWGKDRLRVFRSKSVQNLSNFEHWYGARFLEQPGANINSEDTVLFLKYYLPVLGILFVQKIGRMLGNCWASANPITRCFVTYTLLHGFQGLKQGS